jgi:alcohol dehydrogenase
VGLLLPYVLEASRATCGDALLAAADALGVAPAAGADQRITAVIDEVQSICTDIGIPPTLADIGVTPRDLPEFAAQTSTFARLVQNAPVRADERLLLAILQTALDGNRARLRQP